jgi:hypothetical protein
MHVHLATTWVMSGLKSRRSKIEAVLRQLLPILLPSRWTTPVPGGQLWNVGPAHGPQRTVLDDLPTPTDQKVVPAVCPMGWLTGGYDGHSRTTPQASRSGLTHVSHLAEET